MKNFFLIVNPIAGEGRALKKLPLIENVLRKQGVIFESLVVRNEPLQDVIKKALGKGYRNFVCVGGDGTLNLMIQHLVDIKDVNVAILPAGSGNDMARSLGFSSHLSEVEVMKLLNGNSRPVDIGICNGRYFCNSLGIGFDARVASDYNKSLFMKGKSKYLFQIIKNILFYRSEVMEIENVFPLQKTFLISIGNGKTSGGGVPLTPEASLEDGLLDVCVIREMNIFQRARNLLKGLKGKHLSLPFVKYFKTVSLKIRTNVQMLAHMDGEIFMGDFFDIKLIPKKLKFIFAGKE